MSQRRDDTTEPREHPPATPARAPGRYYYDDATGYEPYNPAPDEDDDHETAGEQTATPTRG